MTRSPISPPASSIAARAGSSGRSTASSSNASERYGRGVAWVLRKCGIAVVAYVGLLAVGGLGFLRVPDGFVPVQDKDYVIAFAQLPDAASLSRTEDVIRRMSDIIGAEPGVESVIAFSGMNVTSGFGVASNSGVIFATLIPQAKRGKGQSAGEIQQSLQGKLFGIEDAYRRRGAAAAGDGHGHAGRLQDADRRSQLAGISGAESRAAGFPRRRQPDAGRHRRVFRLSRQCAADLCGHRPREGQARRRAAGQCVRCTADLSRLDVRQRPQPLRAQLPGDRAGRCAVPRAQGADPRSQDPQCQGRDGAAGFGHDGEATASAPTASRTTTAISRPTSTARPRPAPVRRAALDALEKVARERLPRWRGLRVDRPQLPGNPRRAAVPR